MCGGNRSKTAENDSSCSTSCVAEQTVQTDEDLISYGSQLASTNQSGKGFVAAVLAGWFEVQ